MKRTLIALNLIAALLVIPAMWLVAEMYTLRVSSAYTELDRAQVIDQQKLAQSFPGIVPNDRRKFAVWAVRERPFPQYLGIPCMVGFVLNAVLIGLFMERKKKPNQASDATSDPAPGAASSAHQG